MIIVTGGAGFIGSALVWGLNARGREDILVVDELGRDEKWKNLVGLRFLDYIEKDDLLDMAMGGERIDGLDAVLHMGACSSTTCTDATYFVRNNFEYTKVLADWTVGAGARFVYASSAATYGAGAQGYSDDEAALDTLRPLNMYAMSKHLFDLWARAQGLLDTIVGLKYFNVFGPNEYHKDDMRSMVCKGYEQVRDTGRIRLFRSDRAEYPDGGQERDFVYVKDAVDMTLFFLDRPDLGGIYNVGSGEANTWNTLAESIFHALDREPRIEYFEMPESLRGKYQYHTQADMTKLREAGYDRSPAPFPDAVADYVVHYLVPGAHLATADG